MSQNGLFKPQMVSGLPEINPDQLKAEMKRAFIVDVRRPDEFSGELGHIPGARFASLGPNLLDFLATVDRSKEIIFVCRSGGRSGQATQQALQMGFKNAINMKGGMLLWNELNFPVERE